MNLPEELSSASVDEHVDFLRVVLADLRRFYEQSNAVSTELITARDTMVSAVIADETVTVVSRHLDTRVLPGRNLWLTEWSGYGESVEGLVRQGTHIGGEIRSIERRLASAEAELASAEQHYHDVALIDGSDLVSDALAAGERALRSNVEQAYEAVREAKQVCAALHALIREHTSTWYQLLTTGLDIADPSQAKDVQKVIDGGAKTQIKDLTIDKNGKHVPPFKVDKNGVSSIDITDVNQGSLGDCYFLAPVAGLTMVEGGKRYIEQIIHDNGDGTFTVTFPGYPPILVDGEFVDVIGGDDGRAQIRSDYWFLILEKAFAKLRGGYGGAEGGYDAQGNAIGGNSADVMQLLGLRVTSWKPSSSDSAELQRLLGLVTNHKAVTTASIDLRVLFKQFETETTRKGHAFTVLRLEPGPPKAVVLRNPWGSNGQHQPLDKYKDQVHLSSDGTVRIDLDVFEKVCDRLDSATLP